ncbi:MAG: hypothetical protein LBQ31_11630 [Bacteroidales bacterium]|jgi:hypothetical protein|nr:hypothetical protein [Bacteroidales bacterium]
MNINKSTSVNSTVENKNAELDAINRFYGAWQSEKSAEDMISEIRADRKNSERIVNL